MKTGYIVEYIDKQKIICAVVLEVKDMRLRLLTETNREITLSSSRLLPCSDCKLDLSIGRDKMVSELKSVSQKRNLLLKNIDLKELWEILNTEQEWIDLGTMTEFCFPETPTPDHQSAVRRAFFNDKFYFKFKTDSFFPNPVGKVETLKCQLQEVEKRQKKIDRGVQWLKSAMNSNETPMELSLEDQELVKRLKHFYLFETDGSDNGLAKEILSEAGIHESEKVFDILVKIGEWEPNENTDLLELETPITFEEDVMDHVGSLMNDGASFLSDSRQDFTALPLITIDGQATLDYDDALSIERLNDGYRLGIHIADVGYYVKKDDIVDQKAALRASSIYMPDLKIPMIPASLAENLCSLKAGEKRPAISVMITLSPGGEIRNYEITPSIIRVERQLTYFDANLMFDQDMDIYTLYLIAKRYHALRLEKNAVQITLPEVNVWINDRGEPCISRTNRESPGRFLISELMILANWLMAKFLADNQIPGIFRSQPGPKERLFEKADGSLFDNWMQRKLLNRFVLGTTAEYHSGLGLEAYVTATSPIRKYWDLITQRQIRSLLGLERPYTEEEILRIIHMLEQPMANVSRLQYRRHRYWLLKYLENEVGRKQEALVLGKRRNGYQVLLTEYMIECSLPLCPGIELKPEDVIKVTLQNVNARKDILQAFLS
jgi:exoribonuclease-2